ncbi:MAG: hypothetical protein M3Q06_00225 [Bacteroidota bacterium]|nr:hypothetical protein [Bacteroidota bacterium]
MAIQFLDPETSFISTRKNDLAKKLSTLSTRSGLREIDTSADVTGIELRMLPPYIKDNRTDKVWPFPGYAKLYCLTLVASNVTNQLIGTIDLQGFPRIDDKESLPINKSIYLWQAEKKEDKAPNQIHVFCSVVKSKQSLRDVGEILSKVKEDAEYKDLIGSLAKLAKDAAKFNVATDVLTSVASVVGRHLGKVEDKPLGTVINSYTTLFGDFDKLGVSPLVYATRNVDFNFKMVVRSKEEKLATTRTITEKPELEVQAL